MGSSNAFSMQSMDPMYGFELHKLVLKDKLYCQVHSERYSLAFARFGRIAAHPYLR